MTRRTPRVGDWSRTEDLRLMAGWDLGCSASEIASEIPGRTRNAVIGRAHRLNLKPRPSPIRR